MIKYSLKCPRDHSFDSWFANAEAFDTLAKSGLVTCAVCGEGGVSKAIMAPRVASRNAQPDPQPETAPGGESGDNPLPTTDKAPGPLSAPATPAEQALRDMRAHVKNNAEYVGTGFAAEARAIHDGTSPERSIYGEASPKEAKELVKDGVSIAPLPFMPDRKTN